MAQRCKNDEDLSLYQRLDFEIDANLAHSVLDSVLENLDDLLMEHLPAAASQMMSPMTGLMAQNHIREEKMDRDMGSKTASFNSLASLDTLASAPELLFNGPMTRVAPFCPSSSQRLQLKDYVFISKDCTRRLADYAVREQWGAECGLLYKYLDYTFRVQTFERQMIEIDEVDDANPSSSLPRFLVFHSGLQRRRDREPLFALLVPNKKYVAQSWRVQFGNIRNSFVSRRELLAKLKEPRAVAEFLPRRTRFQSFRTDAVHDCRLPIAVDWEERLTTNKDRLCRVLGSVAFFDRNWRYLRLSDLVQAFEAALDRTLRRSDIARLAVAQGFVDSKHHKFRMELLLPLSVEFPRGSGAWFAFALAIARNRQTDGESYIAKSLLTMEMAYANARLVGYVRSEWLFYGAGKRGN